jgi:hypothetical protein
LEFSSSLYNERRAGHDTLSSVIKRREPGKPGDHAMLPKLSEAIVFVAASSLRLLDPSARFGFATAISADEATGQRFPPTREFHLIDTVLLPEKI